MLRPLLMTSTVSLAWLLIAGLSATAIAQEWRKVFPTATGAACYDSVRGRTVMFGGMDDVGVLGDTWEYDGTSWLHLTSAQPPARQRHAMAYDSARGRTVLFGGWGASAVPLSDTWEYDGATWTRMTPATSPPARSTAAMAYDSARGRTVMFGGSVSSNVMYSDTWEYDGTTWLLINPPASPQPRAQHAMAYDVGRARMVMFGGWNAGQNDLLDDTWEYDGTSWLQASPTASPPARAGHAMACDVARGRTVLFSGTSFNSATLPETWEYDGATWTQMHPPVSPAYGSADEWMVYDSVRARMVLLETTYPATAASCTALSEYDGTTWTRISMPPAARKEHRMCYDSARGRTVLFGGTLIAAALGTQPHVIQLADTLEYDGTAWMQRTLATSPAARRSHSMTYDLIGGRTLLFGGYGASGTLADTWAYDGSAWTLMTPATSPPARFGHAMTYDLARTRTVLFAGKDGSNIVLKDTWEYDGTTWTQMAPPAWPLSRELHAMAYDFARYRTVLFGGNFHGALLADTWEYDGTTWTQVTPAVSPSARERHAMVYDLARGRTVIFGGFDASNTMLADTLEYDGTTWTPMTPATSPPARIDHAMAYDHVRSCTVLFGGAGSIPYLPDTWELTPAAAPTFTRHGIGCPGSAGTPSLDTAAGAAPGLGTTFPLYITAMPQPGFAYLTFGFNLIHWNGAPLPVSLTTLGLPGCQLWIAPAFGTLLAAPSGTATLSLAIPNNPSLVGVSVGAQALSDAAAPGGVGAVSNGAILRLY
jgi:hypothetical protein